MDLVAPYIFGACSVYILNWSKEKISEICRINENLDLLRNALEDLIERRDVVQTEVDAKELKGGRPLARVTDWLSQVQTIVLNTSQLIADASRQDASSQDVSSNDASSQDVSSNDASSSHDVSPNDASSHDVSSNDASSYDVYSNDAPAVHQRLPTSGCCFMCNFSNVYLAGKVSRKLTEVRTLMTRGNFEVVTEQAPPPVVKIRNVQQTFGLDTTLENTWTSLMDDENMTLGIHGIGGIGKTTLLALINNRFADDRFKDHLDVVIWVKVKDADIGKIQDKIGKRLGLYDEQWPGCTREEKNEKIRWVLTHIKNRFVLLFDGLLKHVNLSAIGIPFKAGEKNKKVVFTTRDEDVCMKMGANKNIEVKFLAMCDALDFLKHLIGKDTLNDEMLGLVTKIAESCHGIPLALGVVGPVLKSRMSAEEWSDVLHTLVSFPYMLKGMKEGYFGVIKLSYDSLEKDEQLCFQYCALFPKSYNIRRDELVDYWIGEGILDVRSGRNTAKSRGLEIIYKLVEATLLTKDGESKLKVYMHDMMREMALWIVSEFEHGEEFIVETDTGLSELADARDWTTVTKMSLINNEIVRISDPGFPDQARLKTLFLQNNRLVDIACSFFSVMSNLVVLDLSQNPGLTKLPDFANLVSLRYLKLSLTMITDLPIGFGELGKLIHLDLEFTNSLKSIILISGLSKLEVLKFYGSAAALDIPLLEKLKCMKRLEVLTITVKQVDVLETFLGSKKLGEKTQGLYLEGLEVSVASFAATFGELSALSNLEMRGCNIIETEVEREKNRRDQYSASTSSYQSTPSNTLFKNLSAVSLSSCVGVTDLTWLIYAANLESLTITSLGNLEDVISKKKAAGAGVEPFLNLQVLDLSYLGKLKSVYWSPLSFPKLHQVTIKKCPNLHKLPLNSTSVERIDALRIEVEDVWLDRVEWEYGAKDRFLPVIRRVSLVLDE